MMEITAKEILKLIECVNINNESAIDEINQKACFYIHGVHPSQLITNTNYCKSRDALKDVRPEGWHPTGVSYNCIVKDKPFWLYRLFSFKNNKPIEGFNLPTEELAELHAIIQAIQGERDNANNT